MSKLLEDYTLAQMAGFMRDLNHLIKVRRENQPNVDCERCGVGAVVSGDDPRNWGFQIRDPEDSQPLGYQCSRVQADMFPCPCACRRDRDQPLG